MTARAAAIGAMPLAAAICALPALPWFAAKLPTTQVTITGFGADGSLWILPVLGALALPVAVALALTAPARRSPEALWGGGALLVLGASALLWSLAAALDPPVAVALTDSGVELTVPFAIERRPPAFATPGAAAALALAGALIALPGTRR